MITQLAPGEVSREQYNTLERKTQEAKAQFEHILQWICQVLELLESLREKATSSRLGLQGKANLTNFLGLCLKIQSLNKKERAWNVAQ